MRKARQSESEGRRYALWRMVVGKNTLDRPRGGYNALLLCKIEFDMVQFASLHLNRRELGWALLAPGTSTYASH